MIIPRKPDTAKSSLRRELPGNTHPLPTRKPLQASPTSPNTRVVLTLARPPAVRAGPSTRSSLSSTYKHTAAVTSRVTRTNPARSDEPLQLPKATWASEAVRTRVVPSQVSPTLVRAERRAREQLSVPMPLVDAMEEEYNRALAAVENSRLKVKQWLERLEV